MSPEQSVSILFIDGNDDSRGYYAGRLKLRSSDYIIFEAASGKTGLAIYESVSVDCVVLELDLPDTSGFEILLRLVPIASHPEVAVVVLTRLTSPSLHNIALKNGAQAVFDKSLTSGDILEKAIFKGISTVRAEKKNQA